MQTEILDVLIIGAGVSGIGVGCHMRRRHPKKTVAILERRDAIGGTWDLFRYPGIRSDSDMLTFGYKFRPWTGQKVLADGASIREYVTDTAREYDLIRRIYFGRKVLRASWSSAERCWTVDVQREADGHSERYRARFLVGCMGYYNYDSGHNPRMPGEDDFKGRIVHPQHWPEDLDYTGKRVVVIGSGATAVTLVPAMTDRAAHVTMLQRSPTYVLTVPELDPLANLWSKLPDRLGYRVARARNVVIASTLYRLSLSQPTFMKRVLLDLARRQLRGKVDIRHFTPSYDPWTQRLCAVPNGDLFRVLRRGKASIVTDQIESFTPSGVRLRSGEELPADIIVKATGLNMQLMGGVEVSVDGTLVQSHDLMVYKGVLAQDLPNAAVLFGYANNSWTLKIEVASEYLCRLLKHMDRHGYDVVVAHDREGMRTEETLFGSLDSGYVHRAANKLPRQGKKAPWRVVDDYLRDIWVLRLTALEDGILEFSRPDDTSSTTRPTKRSRLGLGRRRAETPRAVP